MPLDPSIIASIRPPTPFNIPDIQLRNLALQREQRLNRQMDMEEQARQQELADRQQELADKRQREEEAKQTTAQLDEMMRRIFASGKPTSEAVAKELADSGQFHLFPVMAPHLKAFDELQEKIKQGDEAKKKSLAEFMATAQKLGSTPAAFNMALQFAKTGARWTDEELAPLVGEALQDPTKIPQVTAFLSGQVAPKAPSEAKLGTVEDYMQRFAAENGKTPDQLTTQEVAEGLKAFNTFNDRSQAVGEAKPGSFEDYVLRLATEKGKKPEQLTTQEIEAARKKYQQADDRPTVTVRTESGMTPGQEFSAVRQLRNDFNRETSAARTVQQQLALMKSSLDAVKKGSAPAGSQGVLVTFQKILDPTSVVRESEYARSASGLSLLGRIDGYRMKIMEGGAGVTVGDLQNFVNLAEQFAKNQAAFANQSRQQIDEIARRYKLNPADITRDIAPPEMQTPDVPTGAPAGGGAVRNYQDYLKSRGK